MVTARSAVPFRTGISRRPIDALEPAIIHHSSRALGWDGITAEIGSHRGWIVDDLVVDGYYLAVNIDDRPLVIESRERGRFVRKVVPPGTLVIHPYGEAFSFRVGAAARWAGVVLAPSLVRQVCDGRPFGCAAQFGVRDAALLSGVNDAIRHLQDGTGQVPGPSEAALLLAANLAVPPHGRPIPQRRGGLSLTQIRRVEDFVEGNLAGGLMLSELAGAAGLSLWHFARAFKAATGQTPHQFVMARRLAHALRLLARTSQSITSVAVCCGFSDQAHLTRCFRSRYGTTPAAYRRLSRT
ncbi:AraC family transcriptional regulator [Roseomonas fluvialis]|uniref:AraC family transcriptional regulator n=1 Tax=Roseomonas fluvialis TaxID=1750527 RepID=A0ABN6P0Q6_9PROT|nr:AraC family transcriptional regulator [Roseomonas fluvialis]BDG72241.1 AraC family transcriptional regulator [Roseomonas fluvialis]